MGESWKTHYEFMPAEWQVIDAEARGSSGCDYIAMTDQEIEELRGGKVLAIWIAGTEYRCFVKRAGTAIQGLDEEDPFTEGAGQWPYT